MQTSSLDGFCTSRITAERLRAEHAELIHQMHQDERIMANLGGRRSLRETQDYMKHNLMHWETHGFGIWVLRESATGCFVGRGGLRNATFEENPEVEVAYGLLPKFWNRGLATEFTRRVVGIGSVDLGLSDIVSITVPQNLASRRVMEKAGFDYERDILFKGEMHLLYRWRRPNTADSRAPTP